MKPIPTHSLRHHQVHWLWFVTATVLLLVLIPVLPVPYRSTELLIPAIGGLWGFAFYLQNSHKEDARFMKELFEYFNQRYNDQNNDLQTWLKQPAPFSEAQELGFTDYFNLCAEEFVFHRLGYIYDEVWASWLNGMRQYGRDPRVAALWREQRKTNSYYGFEFPIEESRPHPH